MARSLADSQIEHLRSAIGIAGLGETVKLEIRHGISVW
jgi:hypothetical protein